VRQVLELRAGRPRIRRIVRFFKEIAVSACRLGIIVAFVCAAATPAWALDRVVMKRDGVEHTLVGRFVVTAEDGGVMVETRDGAIWTVPPEEQVSKSSDAEPYRPFTTEETIAALRAELPPGFEIYQTKHYIICFNTSRAYAQWCGSLFERLYQAFQNYWTNRGFELKEPEHPLTAIVFADRASYARFARNELGDGVDAIIGYYSLRTNRMTMYDLTGTAGTAGDRGSATQISQTLAQPDAAKTVATIVHEATHQIAFNCGLHRRYADIPLWVSEGLAVYFETPDVGNSKGWSTIGAVNHSRLLTLRNYGPRRPADSLETLIRDDARMRNPQQAVDAYAEAWALNYFLLNARSLQYRAYIKELAAKEPLSWDKPEERLEAFRRAFGNDLTALDREFQRYISRLR
jgi:hypothetical protein